MPHPLYGPPTHSLESVTVVIKLPSQRNGHRTSMLVTGDASTSRRALWSVRESWSADEVVAGLQPSDAAQHILLIALQDRPDSQSSLERQLVGGGWEDVPLPF